MSCNGKIGRKWVGTIEMTAVNLLARNLRNKVGILLPSLSSFKLYIIGDIREGWRKQLLLIDPYWSEEALVHLGRSYKLVYLHCNFTACPTPLPACDTFSHPNILSVLPSLIPPAHTV